MPFRCTPIRRIHAPSLEQFEDEHRRARVPVLITGVVDSWPATQRWSFPYLRDRLGQREVAAYRSADRFFPGRDQVGSDGRTSESDGRLRVKLPASELLDRIARAGGGRQDHEQWYLYAFSLASAPDLLEEVRTPDLARPGSSALLWMSGPGYVTPTHFDARDNLFGQVCGAKQIFLFPPSDFARLYPHGADHHYARHAQPFDLAAADLSRYPQLAELEAIHAVLEPGTLLFIPSFWWHCVHTTALSVSVSFFDPVFGSAGFPAACAAVRTAAEAACDELPGDLPFEMKAYMVRMLLR